MEEAMEEFEYFLQENNINHLYLGKEDERYVDSTTQTTFVMWQEMNGKSV